MPACIEIEPPIVVLLLMWRTGESIMSLNRKSRIKRNMIRGSLYTGVGLLMVVVGSSVNAATYRIDSQADFDFYKEAEFQPGDTITS